MEKLSIGNSGDLYQLATTGTTGGSGADSVLVIVENAGTYELQLAPTETATLGASLWCANVAAAENQGQNPIFDFTNKAFKMDLAVAIEDIDEEVAHVNGNIAGWKFSATYAEGLEHDVYLASYYKEDNVVVLVPGQNGKVALKSFKASEETAIKAAALKFSLMEVAHRALTATEFNTLLNTRTKEDFVKLTFDKDRTNGDNPFSQVGLKATASNTADYLNLSDKDGKVLRVDTAYTNDKGSKFLGFKFVSKTDSVTKDNINIQDQYKFRFTYCPTSDSVYIDVKAARFKEDSDKTWAAVAQTTTSDSTNVILQNIISATDPANDVRIVTIGKQPINTHIKLGIGGCSSVATEFASLANDLYTIQNSKGQYLAMPIYGDTTIMWVTKEKNVDVTTMPAYQWIVEKTRATDKDNTSPVKITNREYQKNHVAAASLQLYKGDKTASLTANNVEGLVNLAGFTAMSKDVKSNKYLGYKHIDKDEATVTVYNFNYLHEFDAEKYMGTTETKGDSLLYVGGKTAFELVPQMTGEVDTVRYGNYSEKVEDLVPLVRTSYVLKIKDGKKFNTNGQIVVLDKENRYSVSDSKFIEEGDSAIFYLKANNRGDENGKIYYALTDTNTVRPEVVKGGVDDNNLWVKKQNLTETRTSAFAIERDEAPLYRRFNTLDEGTVANDDPDTLKFFRTNNNYEFLYEDAHSVYSTDANGKSYGVNFLGVNNKAQISDTNYAIYADTAYVNRGTGYIKPQYLLGVNVNVQPGGYYCPEHGWNPSCDHAEFIAGYVRARYLINATDSSAVEVNGNDEVYMWNHKWNRLAFVDAIHRGDSLYILRDKFAGIADKDVDFVLLNAASNSKNVINLANNKHKDVVFSFRLINDKPEKDFLIESETLKTNDAGQIIGNRNDGPMIAPVNGGWVKIQNGVPVISRGAYSDAIADAEIFNVVKTDEKPVANETIDATSVSVIAGNGTVTIKGAAGKKVTIANVLGQTIANTVLSSDDATIAAPAGVAVVAVEGEAAVKAIVK